MLRVHDLWFGCSLLLLVAAVASWAQGTNTGSRQSGNQAWRESFTVDKGNLADAGRCTYFILEPGYRLTFARGQDTLTVTVLDETKIVGGVRTRVVEERETSGGQLAEVSRNYFAIDRTTNDVYYFGEDVDVYKNGKIVGHEGAWLSGVNGARFGLMMPANPRRGDRYYQELAPKVAMDRAEIISVAETAKVPAGAFDKVLHTRESSAVEGGSEDKFYAPDIGLIKDAEFVLLKVESRK